MKKSWPSVAFGLFCGFGLAVTLRVVANPTAQSPKEIRAQRFVLVDEKNAQIGVFGKADTTKFPFPDMHNATLLTLSAGHKEGQFLPTVALAASDVGVILLLMNPKERTSGFMMLP